MPTGALASASTEVTTAYPASSSKIKSTSTSVISQPSQPSGKDTPPADTPTEALAPNQRGEPREEVTETQTLSTMENQIPDILPM